MADVEQGCLAYLRYRANGGISVHKFLGKWRVVWRDLSSTKQKVECDSEAEALALARKVRYSDITEQIDDMCQSDLEHACDFWVKYG